MRKFNLLLFTLFSIIKINSNAQDTIFSYPYPNGIIANIEEIDSRCYRFKPVENPNLKIIVHKKEIINVSFASGKKYVNENYQPGDCEILPTSQTTGKIIYSNVIPVANAKIRDLFYSVEGMTHSAINYTLISEDKIDFSFQKYVGSFNVKFAGDPYTVYFNLLIKFKDGRIKYTYSEFNATFLQIKSKQSFNIIDAFANGVNTTANPLVKNLDLAYGGGERNSDKHKFWTPINNTIIQNIETLEKLCSEAKPEKKDNW